MRWATAAALLVALAISPALSLLCEMRCAEPAHHEHAGTHADHEDSPASGVRLSAPALETSLEGKCRSHVTIDPATPERPAAVAIEAAPASLRLLDPLVPLTHAGTLAELRPPPLRASNAAPLRI